MKRRGFLQTLTGLLGLVVAPKVVINDGTARRASYDDLAGDVYVAEYRHVSYGYEMVLEGDSLRCVPVRSGL